MNYTKPSRHDGCWDVEQECHDEDESDYGPVEIFKLRRGPGPAGRGTRRPICVIEEPDMVINDTKNECGGNIALIITAPRVYESLRRASEAIRFALTRGKTDGPAHSELFWAMADAEQTLRAVQFTYDALMAGEHVS